MHALDRTVFSIGRHSFDWADVVLAGHLWGDWIDLEREAREGLACEQHAKSLDDDVSDDDLDAAAREYRYERDLISAEEAEAWLAARGASVADWLDHLERRLLRGRFAGTLGDVAARYPPDPETLERVVVQDGFLTGLLERLAVDLAGRAALAIESGALDDGSDAATDEPPPAVVVGLAGLEPATRAEKARRVARIEAHHQRLVHEGGSPEAIDAVIRDHHLDWMQAEFARLRFADAGAAREAQMCLLVDGEDVDAVAAAARIGVERVRAFLDGLDPAIAEGLLSARPGEPLGPFERGDAFEVVVPIAKHVPRAADPEVRRRAENHVRARLEAAAINRSVRWEWRA